MPKRWEDMTASEKADWLRNEIEGVKRAITVLGNQVTEIGNAVREIEKRLGANR